MGVNLRGSGSNLRAAGSGGGGNFFARNVPERGILPSK